MTANNVLIPCVGMIIVEDNKLVTLYNKQYDDVCFPKGKIEVGENIYDACVRECQEELGILPTSIEDMNATFEHSIGNVTYSISLVRVKSYSGYIVNAEPHKHNLIIMSKRDSKCYQGISIPLRKVLNMHYTGKHLKRELFRDKVFMNNDLLKNSLILNSVARLRNCLDNADLGTVVSMLTDWMDDDGFIINRNTYVFKDNGKLRFHQLDDDGNFLYILKESEEYIQDFDGELRYEVKDYLCDKLSKNLRAVKDFSQLCYMVKETIGA